eukprot:SM000151S01465  [mRNA]  locus=s151:76933:77716:+ [translate_table: standard]
MSWQSYVDDHLMCDLPGGGMLTSAAILGHDGVVWAKSDKFPDVTAAEVSAIMGEFNNPGHLATTGLYLGGVKYMMVAGEAGAVLRGKMGAGGTTVKKTSSALIIGIYDEPVTPGDCNVCVENLGDYLIGQNL